MSAVESTSTDTSTVAIDDPGTGRRLDAAQRTVLRASVKDATRGGAPAVLVRVAGDAWAHRAVPDDQIDAASITRDQHALVRAVHDVPYPIIVHVAGKVSELGLALFLAADVRLLDPDATVRFDAASPASLLSAGVPAIVKERHGAAVADLVWAGASLTADEAVSRGVATATGDAGRAAELAVSLAASPHGTSALRRSFHADTAAGLAERLEYDAWLAVVAARDQR